MFDLFDGNVIFITRGNTATIDITPIDSATQNPFILQNGDKVLFTVKDSNRRTVIKKTLTNADYTDPEDTSLNCTLEAEDTANLLTGDYKYDCLLVTSDGQAVTFISSSFVIKEAVGMYTDVT